MRETLTSFAVVAAVPLATAGALLFMGASFSALLVAAGGSLLLRRRRQREWTAAEGTISSCDEGWLFKRSQSYRCAYVFCVGGTRQGGTFQIHEPLADSDDRTEEIRAALIGLHVRVRFDPEDCTRCMVEDEKVADWRVSNDLFDMGWLRS